MATHGKVESSTAGKRYRGWGKLWALSFGVATVLGFSAAAVAYFGIRLSGISKPSVAKALSLTLPDWYFWALIAPLAIYLARRFPIDRRRWLAHASLHLLVGTVVALTELAIFGWSYRALVGTPEFPTFASYYFYVIGIWFHYQALIYWVIVLATHAVDYYRQYRQRQLETAELEAELARAQLDGLRSQIQPHFLFNSLHTIAMLMRERKVDAATDMIARLGQLLRESLDRGDSQEVPLRDELKLARDYLAIEQVRFGDRLRIRFDVAEEALNALVPSLLLQPLVENAVRHGIAHKTDVGHIDIEARVIDDRLRLQVRDDGPGLDGRPGHAGTHVGLANTRRRLRALYGDRQNLEVASADGGGAAVTVVIPLRASEPDVVLGAAS